MMWIRVFCTALALAAVLYLQFGFDIKDWIHNTASEAAATPKAEVAP